MSNLWKTLGSNLSAFIIGAGGVLAGAATDGHLSTGAIFLAAVFGAIAAAKDYRSLMRLPPVNGDLKK